MASGPVIAASGLADERCPVGRVGQQGGDVLAEPQRDQSPVERQLVIDPLHQSRVGHQRAARPVGGVERAGLGDLIHRQRDDQVELRRDGMGEVAHRQSAYRS